MGPVCSKQASVRGWSNSRGFWGQKKCKRRAVQMGIPKKPYSQKKISHRFGIKKKEDEKGEFVEEE
jgi:hypothetical protein